ncbi:hypothetical protein KNV00_gp037 [Streptomyces phage Bmoc]|uniref:Uncharacterized protein n=1 Tax=Streptomyces phage Bmoc TaxID=2725629 RepID=A0A6M3T114_9CAUD|nr:hypothetical protein KNV00_gp018 [Streptomyces phage Bmoc]YP_010107633.1 hypothetical protein KNV00_gp037 [Streptomyces phage Bmoc]QJD50768.1 hypothetical protein SEA_BMOC_18 [Streptomyces phage Bmoc]QJD50982.1 hypothetical protein SEA_BMOC_274 [Streptomyces phage Bmoc]
MAKRLRSGQRRRNKHWVNVYFIDRAYGGPEEGGRWFNYGVCVESWQHRSRKRAEKTYKWAKAQRRYQGSNREIWSVNHRLGDTVRIEFENHEGADWDEYRPYE